MQLNFKKFEDKDGTLVPIEFFGLFFTPKRLFYIHNVPKDTIRGNHAHYKTQQLLICLRGKILVSKYNGVVTTEQVISQDEYVYVPNLVWDYQKFLTGDDILLSLCSTHYDPKDYIDDMDQFRQEVFNKQRCGDN